jgi:hypothetical protein
MGYMGYMGYIIQSRILSSWSLSAMDHGEPRRAWRPQKERHVPLPCRANRADGLETRSGRCGAKRVVFAPGKMVIYHRKMVVLWELMGFNRIYRIYPLVICYIAIENGHLNSELSHETW